MVRRSPCAESARAISTTFYRVWDCRLEATNSGGESSQNANQGNNNSEDVGVNPFLDGWLGAGSHSGAVGITKTRLQPEALSIGRREQSWNPAQTSTPASGTKPAKQSETSNDSPSNSTGNNPGTSSTPAPENSADPVKKDRVNFNLRGHHLPITLAAWNRSPLKLATCDDSGIIYVWVPYEDRWSVELVNDRSVKVRDFCWSPSGGAALITYCDGFVLIGSATGQRIWSHAYEETITAGAWSPDSRQIILSTGSGSLHLLSDQGVRIVEHKLRADVSIEQLKWSAVRRGDANGNCCWSAAAMEMPNRCQNYRDSARSTLAVGFKDGRVYFMRSYDDPDPVINDTKLKIGRMTWSMSGEYLALVGRPRGDKTGAKLPPQPHVVHIYDGVGKKLLAAQVPLAPDVSISGLTWAHDRGALVLAAGGRCLVARVDSSVPPLRALASYNVWRTLAQPNGPPGVGAGGARTASAHATALAAVHTLPLPPRERAMVQSHDYHIIQCRVPEPDTLLQTACKATAWRWYCTIRPVPHRPATYVLYAEHMGGLVPVLTGRQVNRLVPEFEIRLYRRKVAKAGSGAAVSHSRDPSHSRSATPEPQPPAQVDAQQTADLVARSATDLPCGTPVAATPHAEPTGGNQPPNGSPAPAAAANGGGAFVRGGSNVWRRSKRQIRALVHRAQQQCSSSGAGVNSATLGPDVKNEAKLVHVSSNVWCTRFKIVGLAPDVLPPYLGQVLYKTSVLHLQPRQMTVHCVDLAAQRQRSALPAPPSPANESDWQDDVHPALCAGSDDGPPVAPTEGEIFATAAAARERVALNARVDEVQSTPSVSSAPPSTNNGELALRQVLGEFDALRQAVDRHIGRMRHFAVELQASSERLDLANQGVGGLVTGREPQSSKDNRGLKQKGVEKRVLDVKLSEQSQLPTCSNVRRRSSPLAESETKALIPPSRANLEANEHWRRTLESLQFIDADSDSSEHSNAALMNRSQPNPHMGTADVCGPDMSVTGIRTRALSCDRSGQMSTKVEKKCVDSSVFERIGQVCTGNNADNAGASHQQLADITLVLDKLYKLANELTGSDAWHGAAGVAGATAAASSKVNPHAHGPPPAMNMDNGQSAVEDADSVYELRHRLRDIASRVGQLERRLHYGNELLDDVRTDLQRRVLHIKHVLDNKQQVATSSGSSSQTAGPSGLSSSAMRNFKVDERCAVKTGGRNKPPHGGASASAGATPRHASSTAASVVGKTTPISARTEQLSLGKSKHNTMRQSLRYYTGWSLVSGNASSSAASSTAPSQPPPQQQSSVSSKSTSAVGPVSDMDAKERKRWAELAEGQAHDDALLVLQNKTPFWNEQSQVYQLDFGGRVTQESAKNFQIEHSGQQVMQFGRIENGAYTLDFQAPFSAVQAFAVALASITQRLKVLECPQSYAPDTQPSGQLIADWFCQKNGFNYAIAFKAPCYSTKLCSMNGKVTDCPPDKCDVFCAITCGRCGAAARK